MSDASLAGSTTASSGTLALAVLCAQQVIVAYDAVSTNVAIQPLVAYLNTILTGVPGTIGCSRLRRLFASDLCNNPRRPDV